MPFIVNSKQPRQCRAAAIFNPLRGLINKNTYAITSAKHFRKTLPPNASAKTATIATQNTSAKHFREHFRQTLPQSLPPNTHLCIFSLLKGFELSARLVECHSAQQAVRRNEEFGFSSFVGLGSFYSQWIWVSSELELFNSFLFGTRGCNLCL